MDEKTALEIIVAHACCKSNLNMCGKCPWGHTDDCRDTILEEESVKMKLSEIKISNAFASTTPKDDKLNACRNYWKENHEQDRDIVVNKNNVLIDGYMVICFWCKYWSFNIYS